MFVLSYFNTEVVALVSVIEAVVLVTVTEAVVLVTVSGTRHWAWLPLLDDVVEC